MTLSRRFDRTVTITPRVVDGKDGRGNDVIVDGEPFSTRALRALEQAGEEVDQRDQQTRTYRYLLRAHDVVTGDLLPIDGFARITDGDEVLEIIGTPEYPLGRNRKNVHHVDLKARIVGPGTDAP